MMPSVLAASSSPTFRSSIPSPRASPSSSRSLSALKSPIRLYLILYNVLSFLLWASILLLSLHHLLTASRPIATLQSAVYPLLLFTVSLSLLEPVHALLSITRSPFLSSFLQCFQRNIVLWGALYPVPAARQSSGFALMLLGWSLIEVVRYPFYACNLFLLGNGLPRWLVWLRYSLFIPLYPLGVAGELLCLLRAIPVLAREEIWTLHMPNRANFSFDWVYYVVFDCLLYLPGLPFMLLHLWRQRRKVLAELSAQQAMRKKAQ